MLFCKMGLIRHSLHSELLQQKQLYIIPPDNKQKEKEKKREREMWRSQEWEERCRKHFEHKLSKGVCPFCLREKLIHLSASSSASTTANASASSSSASSSSSSSSSSSASPTYSSRCAAATPPHKEHNFCNNSQQQKQLFRENMATKSEATKETARSFSLDIKENKEEEKQGREEEKKKKRFWAKLLHSKTMKEKKGSSAKWLFY